jgi:6-phosphogluconolactonase
VFVGSWTSHPEAADGGIRMFDLGADGSLHALDGSAPELSAGYLALAPGGRSLYAVDERRDSPHLGYAGGSVVSFAVEPAGGRLRRLGTTPTGAALPCYVAVSPAGDLVVVANHGSYDFAVTTSDRGGTIGAERAFDTGAVSLFPVGEDGTLGNAADVLVLEGRGSGARAPLLTDPSGEFTGEFQASSHPHAAVFHPREPLLVVPDKGTDTVNVLRVGRDGERLRLVGPWRSTPGSGPRHARCHPTLPLVYVANELEPSLTVLAWDASTDRLTAIQTVATVLEPRTAVTWPSEVVVHPSARWVYVANRGDDSISTFPVRPDGTLDAARRTDSLGLTPRMFGVDPTGTWLLVLNQGSGTIVTFAVGPDGVPTPTGHVASVDRPVAIAMARY